MREGRNLIKKKIIIKESKINRRERETKSDEKRNLNE